MDESKSFHPVWAEFERELGFRPSITGPTGHDIRLQDEKLGRALYDKYAAHFPPQDPAISLCEHKTMSGVRIKTYSPTDLDPGRPAVCYFHGGGFVVGNVDRDDAIATRLAKDTNRVIASVEYRLAPEHPYPAGLDDCIEAAEWCMANADSLKTNGSTVLMGVSAGASLALGSALKLIEKGRRRFLQGIVACQPTTLHPDAVPVELIDDYRSYQENATLTLNSEQGMRAFLEAHNAPKTDPYIFCLLHSRLGELPAIYINACERDTLRDDARALRARLDKLGVPNSYDEYLGLPHYFFAFPSPVLDDVRDEYFAKTIKGIAFVQENSS